MNDLYKKKYLKYKNKYYNIKGGSIEGYVGIGLVGIIALIIASMYYKNSKKTENNDDKSPPTNNLQDLFNKLNQKGYIPTKKDLDLFNTHLNKQQQEIDNTHKELNNNIILYNKKNNM